MSEFIAHSGFGKRLSEAFGIRTEESDAEADRETRKARSEHDAALEARRADFELLRSRIEAMPTFVLKLAPNEAMFSCIYKPAILRLRDGQEVDGSYGMVVPAERLDQAVFDAETRAVIAQHVAVKAPNSGRTPIPFASIYVKSKHRPEVYTIGQGQRENEAEDLQRLVDKLAKLEARNLTRDHIFSGRHMHVHARLYAYWSGPTQYERQYERQGVGVALMRVGVKF